jgi:DNA-binding XRE family transcriptional regulator
MGGVTGSAAIAGVSGTKEPFLFLVHLLYHLFTFLSTFLGAFSSRIKMKQRQRAGEEMVRMQAVVYIGERLKNLRTRRALTQEELAAKADIGKNTVNRIERNLTEPHMSTLRKLAQALVVEPHELLEGEGDG